MVEGRRNIDRGQQECPLFVKEMIHVEEKSSDSRGRAEEVVVASTKMRRQVENERERLNYLGVQRLLEVKNVTTLGSKLGERDSLERELDFSHLYRILFLHCCYCQLRTTS